MNAEADHTSTYKQSFMQHTDWTLLLKLGQGRHLKFNSRRVRTYITAAAAILGQLLTKVGQ